MKADYICFKEETERGYSKGIKLYGVDRGLAAKEKSVMKE